MKNISSILSDLSKKSDFVRLIKENNNYFLCPVDKSLLEDNENWETKNVYEASQKPQPTQHKVQITPYYQEFIKFITYFTQTLIALLKDQQNVENLLFDEQDATQQEMMDNFQINPVDSFQNDEKIILENMILPKDNQEYRASKKLQKIVDNFQSLMIMLMIEQGDFQIQFKNPQKLSSRQFKDLQFEKLPIQLIETFLAIHGEFEQSSSIFEKIKFYLQKQNLKLRAKHLEVDLNFEVTTYTKIKCYDDNWQFEGIYNMPMISSNYIYLQIYYDKYFFCQITINLYPDLLIDHYRGKCVIQQSSDIDSDSDIDEKVKGYMVKKAQCYYKKSSSLNKIKTALQIPSILDGALCFIYDPKVNDLENLKETMLEDQMILLIKVLNKKRKRFRLKNSVSMIITDLFYD
ncbi:hypothetical protein ABPG74_019329 [Tetrahymena malaccensis]